MMYTHFKQYHGFTMSKEQGITMAYVKTLYIYIYIYIYNVFITNLNWLFLYFSFPF